MKRSLGSCSSGAVAVVTALVLPLLLGFTSLGVEVGHWYLSQRQMQGAADAAAISAAAQYIQDQNAGNTLSTAYQATGQHYAGLNGFAIPIANTCLVTSSGDNCGPVRTLDPRAIVCGTPPCIVVEISQNTMQWLTTQMSIEPNGLGHVQSIPAPTLLARAVVSVKSQTETVTRNGTDCILALANDPQAVLVHGNNADIKANCGIAVDGGRDQNVSGTPLGGITFNGASAKVNISALVIAGPASSTICPDGGAHCQQFGSAAALPATAVKINTATQDPYAATLKFPTPPLGVQTGGAAIKTAGIGYTNGTRTFTVVGGTGTPAKFTATVSVGKVTAIGSVIDPGAYTAFPTNPVSVTPDIGAGSGATFTLTEGCFTWSGTPIAGRKYCSMPLNGVTVNFPTGSYYIAGGDNSGCGGFCVSGNAAHVTSDVAGVTFYLTNGDGTGSRGTNAYATVNISGMGNSGSIALCAPGTGCGTGCTGSCMLFVQNPAATTSTSQGTPATTVNSFSGDGHSTLSGLIYLPRQTFQSQGNSTIAGCFGVIAKYVDVGGTPTFSNGCLPGSGIGGTTTTTTVLSNPHLSQ
jgi:hypothetical protein